jgi:hypothetical protein
MRKLGLLLAAMLLIALLPQPAKAAEQSVYIVDRQPFNRNVDQRTFSASRSGSIELDGGWGASVKYRVAPAAGAPVWRTQGTARGQVYVASVTFSLVVKVFYVSLSSGLGYWTTVSQDSGSTYMDEPVTFNGQAMTRPYPLYASYSLSLPSSGDYPMKVRLEYSVSASGTMTTWGFQSNDYIELEGGAEAYLKVWGGNAVPPSSIATLSVSSTPISVTVSYSGTVSGSASTPFTLYGVDKDLTVTLNAPGSVTVGGKTYNFVKWSTSDGETTSTSVTVTVSKGSSKSATAVYQEAPATATLTVQVYRAAVSGPTTAPANGTKVKIGNTVYTADSSGRVSVTVNAGSTVSVQILDTYYRQNLNVYWRRYTFWRWSDGSTSNPRSFTVSSSTTLTAYVYDERLLLVLYEPRYGSDPWGVKAVSLPSRYNSYVGQMLPYNASFWLRSGESFTLQAVEGGAARFLRWDTATECYPRNPYTTNPVISLTVGSYGLAVRAVFRLGPSNQTMYLPGEGVPNPVFWPIYEQYAGYGCDGRKGTWLLNVTALTSQAQTAFNLDSRVWIYALLVNSSSILDSVWVPVNGSWKLRMDKDWDAAAHKLDDCSLDNPYADACRYVAYDANSVSDFPQVVAGAPSKYRGWRLIGLAAWKPLLPGESYSRAALDAVWSGSATYALYNVTFKHVDSGWVYWQPVAVSALKIVNATARYKLSSYDSQLRRSPIYMWIEAVVNWTYVPPNSTLPSLPPNVTLWMAGFKPHRIGNAGVALENDAGVVVWAARGSAYGTTGKLYTLSIGDTELFYREPKGLNQANRTFWLVARFVARAGQPGVRVDDGIPAKAEMSFKLAPATAFIAGFANNDPSQLIVDWSFFTSGSNPGAPGRRYPATLYYEWGPVDPYNGTLPPLGRSPPLTGDPPLPIPPVNPDYWVAFYPIPYESGEEKWTIKPGQEVPVPLYSKYPPRARG